MVKKSLFNNIFKKYAGKHLLKVISLLSLPKLLNTLLLLVVLYTIFETPKNTKSINKDYWEKMEIYYGTINKFKAPVIIGGVITVCIFSTILFNYLSNGKKKLYLKWDFH